MSFKDEDILMFSAPWGRVLKGISAGVVILMVGIAISGIANGSCMLMLFPFLLILALPFIIRGYAVSEGMLIIKRVGWETKFPLDHLQSVEVSPNAMKGSIRLFGNGGLFSFTGLYRNKKLGNYRAFVNDWHKCVILRFAKRTIVVSPNDPDGFVAVVEERFVVPPLGGSAERPPSSIAKATADKKAGTTSF